MKKILCFLFLAVVSFSNCYNECYGAIAIDSNTGATGYSYNYANRTSAERMALNSCGQNCEVAVWFRNTCAAVAYSYQNKTYGWSWGSNDLYTSQRRALAECTGSDCTVVASVCTTRWN